MFKYRLYSYFIGFFIYASCGDLDRAFDDLANQITQNETHDKNTPPIITSSDLTTIAEKDKTWHYFVTTIDADGDEVTLSLLPDLDTSFFRMDSKNSIRFISTPDFETPLDQDSDNIYQIRIRATDSHGAYSEQILSIFVTDISSGFSLKLYNEPASTGFALTTGDVNGDGYIDILIGSKRDYCNNCSDLITYLNTSNGNFDEVIYNAWNMPGGDLLATIEAADLNNDGYDDLFACGTADRISWSALSLGNGRFEASTEDMSIPTWCDKAKIDDFNNDGFKDVLTQRWGHELVTLWPGQGDGTFNTHQANLWGQRCDDGSFFEYCLWSTSDVDIGHLDSNASLDAVFGRRAVIASNQDNWAITTALTTLSGELLSIQQLVPGYQADVISLADINNDYIQDILGVVSQPGHVKSQFVVLIGKGNNIYKDPIFVDTPEVPSSSHTLKSTDINQDGYADLIFAATHPQKNDKSDLIIRLGIGDGSFTPAKKFKLPALLWKIDLQDVNQDGYLDVIGLLYGPKGFLILYNNGE